MSGRHAKELRRLKRRLEESGQCRYRVLQTGEPIEGWIERFLDLEARGWKGREHTALASAQGSRRFFEQATHTRRHDTDCRCWRSNWTACRSR